MTIIITVPVQMYKSTIVIQIVLYNNKNEQALKISLEIIIFSRSL